MRARSLPLNQRRGLVTKADKLSIRRQCQLLGVNRSSHYYKPVPDSALELSLMQKIDDLHLKHPFYVSRKIAATLRANSLPANRKRVQRLMRKMGIEGIAPKPNTSKPSPDHVIYPYLLRHRKIERFNDVWAADITYIPMAHGFGYLVGIIDWYSRRVLSWRLSNTMDVIFCIEALQKALSTFGPPKIFNTDQGSQFTSADFTGKLLKQNVMVSMDGRGRWMGNVFIERLWRSLKYEEVYLHAYKDLAEARAGIGDYFDFYNFERPHQALGNQTPAAFFDLLIQRAP